MKVTYVDHMGTDLNIVNSARVSFKKESDWEYSCYCDRGPCDVGCPYGEKKLGVGDTKLINYLASHGHHSPFNHTFISMHVKAPIFVARQLQKHKFMPWNEVSRRYVDDEPEFYFPEVWRGRSKDKKQGSSDEVVKIDSWWLNNFEIFAPEVLADVTLEYYNMLIEDGVAPEQARMVLPQNTYTEWYWSGTLGAWSDMYNLRSKPDTQLETQEIANQAGEILSGLFPVSWQALTQKDKSSV